MLGDELLEHAIEAIGVIEHHEVPRIAQHDDLAIRDGRALLLIALLEPIERLRELERDGDYTTRLALLEELKGLPFGAVWDMYCLRQGAPVGMRFVDEIKTYERDVLSQRG